MGFFRCCRRIGHCKDARRQGTYHPAYLDECMGAVGCTCRKIQGNTDCFRQKLPADEPTGGDRCPEPYPAGTERLEIPFGFMAEPVLRGPLLRCAVLEQGTFRRYAPDHEDVGECRTTCHHHQYHAQTLGGTDGRSFRQHGIPHEEDRRHMGIRLYRLRQMGGFHDERCGHQRPDQLLHNDPVGTQLRLFRPGNQPRSVYRS